MQRGSFGYRRRFTICVARRKNPNDTFDTLNGPFASFESFLMWFPNLEKVSTCIHTCVML